jgi:hypothetical protein
VSKRELRTLARRLAKSDRPELRAVARALNKLAAGEVCSSRHHESNDYDPFRCAACVPDLWVVYAIGVAYPDADATDLAWRLAGLQGLSAEDVALALDAARSEDTTPDVTHAWLAMRDRQDDELREIEPGWHRHPWGTWARDDEPPESPPEVEALRAEHAREIEAFTRAHSLIADPEVVREIRYGADRRKARALMRASFRKGNGVNPSWLL